MTLRALGGNPGGGQVPLVRVETCSPDLRSPRVVTILPRWRLCVCDVMCPFSGGLDYVSRQINCEM